MSIQEGNKKGLCPGCGGELKGVHAEAHYGRYILLDQCDSCGGIWFDQWELYYLKEGEANRLDPVDKERLLAPLSLRKGPDLCPVCGINLEPFHDLNLPEDANIERCPECSGLWLNRGELKKYKDHKISFKKKLDGGMQIPDSPSVPIPENHNKRLEKLQSLGKAVSTRVNPDIPDTIVLDEPEIDGKELAKDLVWTIIQVLLRLVLKI